MRRIVALVASEAAARSTPSNYPEPFASRMRGRTKRPLGDPFGITNFGVNLTTLDPGASSALHHVHSRQDEFVYVLEGEVTLVSGDREMLLCAGMCAGFPAGNAAHHLHNRSEHRATYLEVGDRSSGDEVAYPVDDLVAVREDNAWRFHHKDGSPYPRGEGA
jgi:uncharacterized cupin superfamily protein